MYVGKTITKVWHPKMFVLALRKGAIKFTFKKGSFFILNTLNKFIKTSNESKNWIVAECSLEYGTVCFPYS